MTCTPTRNKSGRFHLHSVGPRMKLAHGPDNSHDASIQPSSPKRSIAAILFLEVSTSLVAVAIILTPYPSDPGNVQECVPRMRHLSSRYVGGAAA